MSAYPQFPLGEICAINPRLVESTNSANDTVVSFVPMAAVDERIGTIAIHEDRPLSEVSKGYTAFRDGDILFAKITPCMENGKIALARNLTNGSGRGSTEFFVLRPGNRVLGEYLYHFVRQQRFRERAKRSFTGTVGQQRVPKSFMESVPIPLPSLNEQRRLVRILNRVMHIESLCMQASEHLCGFTSALFLSMFSVQKGQSRKWPVATVEQLLSSKRGSIRTGPFGSQLKHSEFTTQGAPVLGIDNVVANRFLWATPRCIPPEKYAKFSRYRVFPGDVIVTIMGTTGRVCVAPDDLPESMSTKHLCVLTLNRSLVDPVFVWGALLFDESVRAQTRVQGRGQIMEGWNLRIVKNLQLYIPPLDLQRKFRDFATRTMTLQNIVSTTTDTASRLKASVMDGFLQHCCETPPRRS